MKYEIVMTQKVESYAVVEVEAHNEEQAKIAALNLDNNKINWETDSHWYESQRPDIEEIRCLDSKQENHSDN